MKTEKNRPTVRFEKNVSQIKKIIIRKYEKETYVYKYHANMEQIQSKCS